MYSLIFLALLGSVASVPISKEAQARNESYILPTTTFPTFYDVRLFIDPQNEEYFYGNVSIRIIPNVNTREIVMHAMEMVIDNIEIYSDRDEERAENLYYDHSLANDTHFLKITLNREIGVFEPHVVHINYVAQYAENMFGVYVSNYVENNENKSIVTSQLQPTFARRAFPCYDEPARKAKFRTTIYAPPEYLVVRSNMPLRNDTLQVDVPGYTKHEFDDTLIMSTYLIAYLVSNFESITNHANPIYDKDFAVYSRPGTQEHAEFALDFGQKNLLALEEYTDFPYAFPKMDKVAVPDFAAGAMENWGLVIYREVALLVNEGVTTTSTKQNIGRIICHENMHMWFGNEVSPLSWTYTWLNEGFANFFENYATDFVLPEWRMMDQYIIAVQNVFQSDAVLSVNPMTHPVFTPEEIIGTFNAVAYQKSGSVIRMMQHFLTPDVFRQGLIYYIKDNSRKAVSPPDLYRALQQALDESNHTIPFPLSDVMDRWTNQGGFPVITVTKTAPTANSVSVTQVRYLTDRSLCSTDRWHIPVNWVLSSDIDFEDTSPQHWIPINDIAQSINIPGLADAEWYLFNKQQTGYYRVNYDETNWEALSRVLATSHESIHLLNRAQLIDDAFNLARNGRLNYIRPLELSLYLVREKDYIPWAAANAAFTYLDTVLSGSQAAYELYQMFILELTEAMYTDLGFEVGSEEEHVTAFHRNIIINMNCRYGNEDCLNTATRLLTEFKEDPSKTIHPDIQTSVYCSSLRGGSRENFDFLWNLYLDTTDSSQQSILLNALGCTSNAEARTFYLNQVIADDSPVREQDRHTIVVSVTNASPANTEAAFAFITENFHLIQPRVQGLSGTTNILNAFSRTLTSRTHQEGLQVFINTHNEIFTSAERASIAAIQENLAAAITWSDENFSTIDNWLDDNYGNGAISIKSGIIMFISVILTILHN